MSRTLLVVDDDLRLCATLEDSLRGPDLEVVSAGTLAAGISVCRSRQVDVVLLDQQLPDGQGASICPAILREDDQTKIIFVTAYPSYENAISAVRHGAFDYLAKPLEIESIRLTVGNALRVRELEAIEELHHRDATRDAAQASLVGSSLPMQAVKRWCRRAARSSAPVLIVGETGTGKTLLARNIHYQGQHANGPFVALNCAALPESLAESELFGHEKGAFTGASNARRGVFEVADRGTVLLDEIGTMPLTLQAKLLGVLEDRTFRRVGSEVERKTSARVVAATNTDLEEALAAGRFRNDLYFRLNVIRVDVPPLREHKEDLPELCAHLIARLEGGGGALAEGEVERLAEYDWPGNVRELRNLLERASIIDPQDALAPSGLLVGSTRPTNRPRRKPGEIPTLAELERRHIEQVLAELDSNFSRTARALGISLSTLKRKVSALGLK